MSHFKTDVCAVIVTYNPDNRLLINCALLQKQVDLIVIVDNGSKNKVDGIFTKANRSKIDIIHNARNVGLAAALNIGIRYAKNNYRWILTFDQDSIITDSFVDNLMEAYNVCPNNELLAIVAPYYKDQTTGIVQTFRDHKAEEDVLYAAATTTITSGNLIASHVFDKVGMFREDFFIDYIDNDFCLRCQRNGYRIIESTKACLLHNVGEPRQYKLLWKTPLASNHPSSRRYYITRNRIIVYKTYIARYPKWVFGDIYLMFKDIIKVLVYEDDTLNKYRWILRGARDAMLNRMGPIKAYHHIR